MLRHLKLKKETTEKYKAIWTKIEDLIILNEMLYQSLMTDILKLK